MYMQCGETIVSDESGMYTCNLCNFKTSHKGNYRVHIKSTKHKTLKAKCPPTETIRRDDSFQIENAIVSGDNNFKPEMVMQFISTMMNQQHEFQMNMVNKFVSRDAEHTASDHSIQNSHNPTTTNSHNTTTNTKFNLNVFLNEDCKNAMNMNEFIQSVNITSEDLENIGEFGYTDGMSKILTKALRAIETTERPMHCTDAKRETIYVRKDDAWKKDDDCEETKRLITHIAHKNYKALSEWSKEHPEHTEHDTADYEAWYTISRNMCNTDPAALKKLIRHLALTTAVEKNPLI